VTFWLNRETIAVSGISDGKEITGVDFMGIGSWWHWVIVLAVVLLLFGGKGKISSLMGDFGKGLKTFKKNMKDESDNAEDEESDAEAKRIAADGDSEKTTSKDKAANG
jgi:sec-independent protein translocase protein TatA